MRTNFLPFSPPCLSDDEVHEVVDTLKSDWLSTGPKTKAFEEAFAQYVGADAALALNSCTAALHVSLILHHVGPGDEVITTPLTFCATANVVEHVGARVVLADIEPETLLIDPQQVAKKITAKTKAIIPVHFAGHPAPMKDLQNLAQQNRLHLIEDAAHSLPAKIGDNMIGSGNNLVTFSFYANKNMTTGEGGMLTGPKPLVDQARQIALHGMSRNAWNRFAKGGHWRYDVEFPGFKYNMSDLQASLGLVQLRRLNDLYKRRIQIAQLYDQAFKNSPWIDPTPVLPGYQSSRHLYVIRLQLERLRLHRDQFIEELTQLNIGSSVHYTPLHELSFYAKKYGWKPEDFPVAHDQFLRLVSLPLNSRMTETDAQDVIDAVQTLCNRYQK